jgi:hypothetical protein
MTRTSINPLLKKTLPCYLHSNDEYCPVEVSGASSEFWSLLSSDTITPSMFLAHVTA